MRLTLAYTIPATNGQDNKLPSAITYKGAFTLLRFQTLVTTPPINEAKIPPTKTMTPYDQLTSLG